MPKKIYVNPDIANAGPHGDVTLPMDVQSCRVTLLLDRCTRLSKGDWMMLGVFGLVYSGVCIHDPRVVLQVSGEGNDSINSVSVQFPFSQTNLDLFIFRFILPLLT